MLNQHKSRVSLVFEPGKQIIVFYNCHLCFRFLFSVAQPASTATMSLIHLSGGHAAAIILCLFAINLNIDICSSQQVADPSNDYNNIRTYMPDSSQIDFVYHNHDDMTRFLRYYRRVTGGCDQKPFECQFYSTMFSAQTFRSYTERPAPGFPI